MPASASVDPTRTPDSPLCRDRGLGPVRTWSSRWHQHTGSAAAQRPGQGPRTEATGLVGDPRRSHAAVGLGPAREPQQENHAHKFDLSSGKTTRLT